jgi:hypothetical protein
VIQLAFEPAFDPFHAAFRVLQQLMFRGGSPVAVQRLKILDVYMVEPSRCLEIRIAKKHTSSAKAAAACQPATYGRRPSTVALYNRMSPMQDAAVQTLVLKGVIDPEVYEGGDAALVQGARSERLFARVEAANERQQPLLQFLCGDLDAVRLNGAKGLKDITGLGEYRYDIV